MNLMCILNLQPLHKAQSIGKPMKRTSAHTDATEHAYDDNTGPRGSDATERAATTPTHTPAAGDIEEPLMPSQLPSKKLCRAATSKT